MEKRELLIQFFASQTTPLQQREIEKWLKVGRNGKMYIQCLEEWEIQNPEYMPDEEKLLARFTKFMNEHSFQATREGKAGKKKSKRFKQLEAAIIIAVLAGTAWTFKEHFLYRWYKTSCREIGTPALKDRSAALNGSSILDEYKN